MCEGCRVWCVKGVMCEMCMWHVWRLFSGKSFDPYLNCSEPPVNGSLFRNLNFGIIVTVRNCTFYFSLPRDKIRGVFDKSVSFDLYIHPMIFLGNACIKLPFLGRFAKFWTPAFLWHHWWHHLCGRIGHLKI